MNDPEDLTAVEVLLVDVRPAGSGGEKTTPLSPAARKLWSAELNRSKQVLKGLY